MSTHFFTLPQELCDEIYGHLWSASPRLRLWRQDGHEYIVHYSKPLPNRMEVALYFKNPPKLPQWLLTNKAIMAEACAEFDRHCTATLAFGHPPAHGAHAFTHFSTGTILGPSTRKELRIVLAYTKTGSDKWSSPLAFHEIHKVMRGYERRALSGFMPQLVGSRVEKLCFWVAILRSPDNQHFVHLEPLRQVAVLSEQLKRVEIEVEEDVFGDRARSTFETSLRGEIEEIGRGLGEVELAVSTVVGRKSLEPSRHAKTGLTWSFVFSRL